MADLSKLRFNGTDYNVKDASAPTRKFTNAYSKTGNLPISSDDTTQTAIGKLENNIIPKSAKGTANGVAELDANGKVPSSQLPSYVDDVLEYSAKSGFPATGESGKIYVDTTTNKSYRWSGSAYVEISESLALGETDSTAYRGDRGKAAYNHSQLTSGNPHNVTKGDVGLGDVGNFKAVSTAASQGLSDTEKSNARANIGAGTGNGTYSKPSGGIPKSDLASAVQTSLDQVNANKTNILYSLQTGVKNIIRLNPGTYTDNVATFTVSNDGEIIINAGSASTSAISIGEFELPAGDYKSWYDSTASNGKCDVRLMNGATRLASEFTLSSATTIRADVYSYAVNSNVSIKPMLCTANAWAQEPNVYRKPALPNYDLTYLQAEDRAALAEEIDAGAKNLVDIADSTTTGSDYVFNNVSISLPAGSYVFSYTSNQSSSGNVQLILYNNSTDLCSVTVTSQAGRVAIPFTISSAANKIVLYSVRAGTYSNFMICTKAAFCISPKFVPFGNDPFYQVPINHNMIYRGRNLGATLTDAQHTALSSGNFTDLYLGDYWTKTVTIPAGTYTGGDGEEVTVPAQTNITLKAVIADFDTFYAGYASSYAGINTHHAAVIVTGFSNVVWNKTNSTAGGYVSSLIHKWLVGSALPQIETWFGSAKVLSHQKLLTNAITGDAASRWAWSSQKISLLSENQMYGSKVWGGSEATNGGYEPGEAFKHLNVFNHIDANLLFGNKNIWLRDIASAVWAALLSVSGYANYYGASYTGIAPAALILLS